MFRNLGIIVAALLAAYAGYHFTRGFVTGVRKEWPRQIAKMKTRRFTR